MALIHLSQIQDGMKLLELLEKVNNHLASHSAYQHILNSEEIMVKSVPNSNNIYLNINTDYVKTLTDDIVNIILNKTNEDTGEPIAFGVIQDILHKLQTLITLYDNCKKVTDGLTDSELSDIRNVVELRVAELNGELAVTLREEIKVLIDNAKVELNAEIDRRISEFSTEINAVDLKVGDLDGLHPFALELLGPNRTVKDALNLVVQIVADFNENINRINDALGADKVDLVNSHQGVYPKPFTIAKDFGDVSGHTKQENKFELGNIADSIKYRKTLNNLSDEE